LTIEDIGWLFIVAVILGLMFLDSHSEQYRG